MSSVSVLPPHPPLTSAARKLALALAESAQKATDGSQRRSAHPHAHSHHLHRPDPPQAKDRPPRPSVLHLQAYPQEYYVPQISRVSPLSPSASNPIGSHCCPHPIHYLPVHLSSEPLQTADGQETMSNFTPNVSPLGSGSLDEGNAEMKDQREVTERPLGNVRLDNTQMEPTYQSIGVQRSSPTQSPSSSAVYVNTDSVNVFNFRTVLAETSMPASVEEVLPRPSQPSLTPQYSPEEERTLGMGEDIYSHHHRANLAGQTPLPQYVRPNALPLHLSGAKSMYKFSSESRYSTLGLNHPLSPQYRGYPRDEHFIGSHSRSQGQWLRSEDRVMGHPGIRRARSFHAPQMSHYQQAETEVLPPDTMFYVQRPPSQEVSRHHWLLQSDLHQVQPYFENGRVQYHHSPHSDLSPADGSHYYVDSYRPSRIRHSQSYTLRSTRDGGQPDHYHHPPHQVPPATKELSLENRDAIFDEARDPAGFDRHVYQPVREENRYRHRATSPVISPCADSLTQSELKYREIMHTRSKSDPGNACLLSVDRVDGQHEVVATSPTSPRPQTTEPEVSRQQSAHWPVEEPVPPRRESVSRRSQIKHGSSQAHRPQQQPPLRKVPSLPERAISNLRDIEHGEKDHIRGREQDRVMMSNAMNSYSGLSKSNVPRRPGRSQSIKEHRHHHHYHFKSPLDPEHPGSFSTQPNRRTQSTRSTHYDHMEGYYPAPKPKPTRSAKPVAVHFSGHGCMSPHSQRLLSKALGHRAFHQTGLRSEAGVYE